MIARRRRLATFAVLLLLVGGVRACTSRGGGGGYHVTAYFGEAIALYPHSKVHVMGVNAGTVDRVTVQSGRVRVDMTVHHGVPLPDDVTATISALTVIGERNVTLGPAWTPGHGKIGDGYTIPKERTTTPVEPDEALKRLQGPGRGHRPGGGDRPHPHERQHLRRPRGVVQRAAPHRLGPDDRPRQPGRPDPQGGAEPPPAGHHGQLPPAASSGTSSTPSRRRRASWPRSGSRSRGSSAGPTASSMTAPRSSTPTAATSRGTSPTSAGSGSPCRRTSRCSATSSRPSPASATA